MSGGQGEPIRTPRVKLPESLAARLHREAGAERFGLTQAEFSAILQEVAGRYLPRGASLSETTGFLTRLHLEDLALARACARGSEAAWETFIARFQESLAATAYALSPANARELADSLYADLYGTRAEAGARRSKLDSFTGRGSLSGWLRAVLAQEYVNRYRRERRLLSLEDQHCPPAAPPPVPAADPRVTEATDEALARLAPDDKYILACYYLDGRTLAEVARLRGVHESTISRRLEKITAAIRRAIAAGLMKRGMRRREAELAMDVEVTELAVNVRQRLTQE